MDYEKTTEFSTLEGAVRSMTRDAYQRAIMGEFDAMASRIASRYPCAVPNNSLRIAVVEAYAKYVEEIENEAVRTAAMRIVRESLTATASKAAPKPRPKGVNYDDDDEI